MIELKVKTCSDCLCCDMNDFCSGYSCKLFRKIHSKSSPIIDEDLYYEETPDWCPLRAVPIKISYDI